MLRKVMLVGVVVLCMAGRFQSATAQTRWLQTVQVVAPVEGNQVTAVLLDTLISVAKRKDLALRRTPEDPQAQSLEALEEDLLGEGLDFTSATRVFITYRFEASDRSFSATITDLHFIYRSDSADEADIPILHVDGTHPTFRHLLINSGTPVYTNEAVIQPFVEQLLLTQLDDCTVVRVGERVIRDAETAKAEKQRIARRVRQLVYGS